MGAFYTRIQKRGLAMLKKKGMAIILRREVQGAYNPSTGTTGASTVTLYNCLGFIASIDSAAANQFYSFSMLDKSSIEKDDKMVVISSLSPDGTSLGIVPDPMMDRLDISNTMYDIVAVIPLSPAGVDVLYALQVRR